jgi:hypothetical protein
MQNPFNPQIAAALLGEKQRAVEQLLALTRKQSAVIDALEWSGLLALLQTKRSVIEHIDRIDAILNPWWKLPPVQRTFPSDTERQACQNRIDRCRAMLEESLVLERDCDERVRHHRQQTVETLQSMDASSSAEGAYVSHGFEGVNVQPGQLDLSSEE